jgi:hypothetical protein
MKPSVRMRRVAMVNSAVSGRQYSPLCRVDPPARGRRQDRVLPRQGTAKGRQIILNDD